MKSNGVDDAYFLIESGPALEALHKHRTELKRVAEQSRQLAETLGVTQVYRHIENGVVYGVRFGKVPVHPDFTKPDRRGFSRPKHNTDWAKKFKAQKGYENPALTVQKLFDIPHTIGYKTPDGEGWRVLGTFVTPQGFLWASPQGPYCMFCPDIPAEVQYDLDKGYTVDEPARSFKMEFEGCQRIDKLEWEIMVKQVQLNEKSRPLFGTPDVAMQRDDTGYWVHPQGVVPPNSDEWNFEKYQQWYLDEHGLLLVAVSMEGQVDSDHPTYTRYNEGFGCPDWQPEVPAGAQIIAIFDSEDGGPMCWYVTRSE